MESGNRSSDNGGPSLCVDGCGLYANQGKENRCSGCFKKFQNTKQQQASRPIKAAPVSEAVIRKEEAATIRKEDEAACFKKLQNEQQATPPTINASTSKAGLRNVASSVDHRREEEAAIRKDEEALIRKEEEEQPKTKRNRCETCNRRVGLLGFNCRCGKVLCGSHRHPNEHSCTFDFKDLDSQVLVKNNPLVRADKLEFRV